jgi:hypothetical protein
MEPMPSVDTRLAALEVLAQDNRAKIKELLDLINGGGDVDYDRSVRGRQHLIATELTAINLRAKLLGEMRQERRVFLKGWEQALLIICAVLTVAASWYNAILH